MLYCLAESVVFVYYTPVSSNNITVNFTIVHYLELILMVISVLVNAILLED